MLRLSTLLLVSAAAALACCSVLALGSTAPRGHHGRPHGSLDRLTAKPARPAHRPSAERPNVHAIASYTPTMAYHEEALRPPRPLYEAQWDLEDFHTSGNYDLEVTGTLNNAMLYAQSAVAANNSLWVFDIDETSLSGYAEMLSLGFGYVPKLSKEWILNASAPAIPQTLALYQQLLTSGFKVAFLTGRTWDEADATAANLASTGYTGYETLITRTPAETSLNATVYKSNRRTILVEQEGYDIVGCIGDQWSDLHGPYTGFKVKVPNYIYYLP